MRIIVLIISIRLCSFQYIIGITAFYIIFVFRLSDLYVFCLVSCIGNLVNYIVLILEVIVYLVLFVFWNIEVISFRVELIYRIVLIGLGYDIKYLLWLFLCIYISFISPDVFPVYWFYGMYVYSVYMGFKYLE